MKSKYLFGKYDDLNVEVNPLVRSEADDIAVGILSSMADSESRCAVITSSAKGEGKTFTVKALANALSGSGKKVLMIDLNYLDPELSITCGDGERVDLGKVGSLLTPGRSKFENIDIAGVEKDGINLASFTDTSLITSKIVSFSDQYDIVLIDTPSIEESQLSILLSKVIKTVVLIVEANTTKRRIVDNAMVSLRGSEEKDVLVVLNKKRLFIPRIFIKLIK